MIKDENGTTSVVPFLILSTAGKFKNITGALNSRISSWTTPKIYYGPENSFCLRPGGSVSFDVSPRLIEGSWQRGPVPVAADVPDAAYVLWGNGSISSAALADGKLTVTASDTPGSALVAIKKGGTMGTILWSYLIWVTAEAPSGIVLPPLGGQLYFQWGRKFKEQYYGQVWIWHDEGWKGLQSIHDRAVQPLLFHSGYAGFHTVWVGCFHSIRCLTITSTAIWTIRPTLNWPVNTSQR